MNGNFRIRINLSRIHAKVFRALFALASGSLLFLAFPLRSVSGTLPINDFTASGMVDSQSFSHGNPIARLTYQFICHAYGDRYSIFLTPLNPGKDDRTTSIECVFDGTNTYFTTRFSTNPVTSITSIKHGQLITEELKHPVIANNDAILKIKSGSIPPYGSHAVLLLWLGFASATEYAAAVTPVFQEPLMYLGSVYDHQRIKLKTAFKIHDIQPGFLEWREDVHFKEN
jgi:hypothetical protein